MFVLKYVINIFRKIHLKIKKIKGKKKLFASIIKDAEKGILTEIEKNNILIRCKELNLVLEDLKKIRKKVYNIAFESLTDNGFLTLYQERELNKLQIFLIIPDDEICDTKKEFKKLRIFTEIINGNPPTQSVKNVIRELSITLNDLKEIVMDIFDMGYQSIIKNVFLTIEHENELKNLQSFLMIPDHKISEEKFKINQSRILAELKNGNPPVQTLKNIILKKNEKAYLEECSRLLEARVTGRSYHYGVQHSEKSILPIASGYIVLTNQRIIFINYEKSFDFRLDKLINLEYADNGFVFNTSNRQKPYSIDCTDPKNAKIMNAILEYSIRNFAL